MATQPIPIRENDNNPQVTIQSNGTYDSVTINNGGVVKFEVDQYPTGTNQCNISLTITFSNVPNPRETPSGTIKIGS